MKNTHHQPLSSIRLTFNYVIIQRKKHLSFSDSLHSFFPLFFYKDLTMKSTSGIQPLHLLPESLNTMRVVVVGRVGGGGDGWCRVSLRILMMLWPYCPHVQPIHDFQRKLCPPDLLPFATSESRIQHIAGAGGGQGGFHSCLTRTERV